MKVNVLVYTNNISSVGIDKTVGADIDVDRQINHWGKL